jgi:all-trans-8'-apo-beta-carotenal 15,15'-oxygenase
MWHSVNAYERGAEIIAEFVGYDSAEDFFGDDSALAAIMRGEEGRMRYPGTIRRYVIDPRGRSLREETVSPGGHEFPYVNPQHMCHDYRFAYLTATSSGAAHDSALARVDMRSGAREVFDFGKNCLVGEPVFIPRPHARYAAAAAHEAGWLASEVFDASAQRSFLALLRSDAVADGPIAKLSLTHHVPYSFHGCWHRA